MNRLFVALALIVVAVVVLGFSRGWFHIESDSSSGKSNVTLSIDGDKFQGDRKTAQEKVQDLGRDIKDKVAGAHASTMDGKMVSINGDKLTMTSGEKEHTHTMAANVQMTCDTKACTAADLKAGMKIRVTTGAAGDHEATRIEALDKNPEFEKATQ